VSRAARAVEEAKSTLDRAKEIHAHLTAEKPSSKCLRPHTVSDDALRDNSAQVTLLLDLDAESEVS
jgi:hypothetical protein